MGSCAASCWQAFVRHCPVVVGRPTLPGGHSLATSRISSPGSAKGWLLMLPLLL